MRISVVINPNVEKTNKNALMKELQEYFFRCHLSFCETNSLSQFFKEEIKEKSKTFIIAGGDGAINFCLQAIMKLKEEGLEKGMKKVIYALFHEHNKKINHLAKKESPIWIHEYHLFAISSTEK